MLDEASKYGLVRASTGLILTVYGTLYPYIQYKESISSSYLFSRTGFRVSFRYAMVLLARYTDNIPKINEQSELFEMIPVQYRYASFT